MGTHSWSVPPLGLLSPHSARSAFSQVSLFWSFPTPPAVYFFAFFLHSPPPAVILRVPEVSPQSAPTPDVAQQVRLYLTCIRSSLIYRLHVVGIVASVHAGGNTGNAALTGVCQKSCTYYYVEVECESNRVRTKQSHSHFSHNS